MNLLEDTYGNFLKFTFAVLNPFKKAIIKTECKVHKFINVQALQILKNDGFTKEYDFFRDKIMHINLGAVWADQDFKSSQHFYNPHKHKGMYGRKSAYELGLEYYKRSLKLWEIAEIDQSMFFLGAALHIIQDMTIPQHANIKLLDNHRQYETFVKRTYEHIKDFKAESGAILLNSIGDYIRSNTREALKAHRKFRCIEEDEQRYYHVTHCALPLAEKTTAGCMVLFYSEAFIEDIER